MKQDEIALMIKPSDLNIFLAGLRARTDQIAVAQANARRKDDFPLHQRLVDERDRIEDLISMLKGIDSSDL